MKKIASMKKINKMTYSELSTEMNMDYRLQTDEYVNIYLSKNPSFYDISWLIGMTPTLQHNTTLYNEYAKQKPIYSDYGWLLTKLQSNSIAVLKEYLRTYKVIK